MKDRRKKPLWRKVNTRTHGVRHGGGEARWDRHTKAEAQNEALIGSMHAGRRNGRDYTPLFKFLLSKVGQDWDAVHSEAVSRLDSEEPIWWMVARKDAEKARFFRAGESSYYSKLWIDADNRLAKVDPDWGVEDMEPSCACCTHTFNGMTLSRDYDAERYFAWSAKITAQALA